MAVLAELLSVALEGFQEPEFSSLDRVLNPVQPGAASLVSHARGFRF